MKFAKYLQIIYIIRDSYLEYIKNSSALSTKKQTNQVKKRGGYFLDRVFGYTFQQKYIQMTKKSHENMLNIINY